MHKQNGLAPCTSIFFYHQINKSYHVSFNQMVEFIDSMVKTSLYLMQDLSHLCTIKLA